jgi:hypothetical protein
VVIETRVAKQKWAGMPVYIGAALVVIAGGIFLELAPKKPAREMELTPEAKAYVRNLQLSDVTMQANQSFANQVVVEIQGKIGNGGDRPLDAVEIYCVFHDSYGQIVLRKRMPIVGGKTGGLKTGETKSFRLAFDELPDSWNHAMPSLVIAGIQFAG